ncbi:hypothetical protein [Fusobacterium sp. SYSU M8D902]|uniref:hypothetical protein n=1 Tax=Fusobacterium sp. SYSU M8D902 TaxID=3159562 RepID=UPI0032E43A11
MKIITTTGFYGTGSSAITDLLSEYENIETKGDFEVRIAHDPYGISDLEYNLIENPNRHNSSNALKKFMEMSERYYNPIFLKPYEKYFNNKFKIFVKEYIKSLYEFKYLGRWHYDIIERGNFFIFASRGYNKIITILKKIIGISNDVNYNLLPKNELAYATIKNQDIFLERTKKFFDKLFNEINVENKEYIMLDQLIPPSNIARYERYFSNIKSIVVDRDPRDMYLLEKKIFKGNIVPHYNINLFCEWYKWTREQYENTDKGNSIRIQFEDLIYNYEKTVEIIENYIGLDKKMHTKALTKFDPKISKKNTKLWEKYKEYKEEIKIIEKNLAKYCYKY